MYVQDIPTSAVALVCFLETIMAKLWTNGLKGSVLGLWQYLTAFVKKKRLSQHCLPRDINIET